MITMIDIREKVESCIERAVARYGVRAQFTPILDTIRGKSMGKCSVRHTATGTRNITLSFNSDAMNMGLDALDNTVAHEVAHALTFLLYGTMKHDRLWRILCIFLGGNGERCHAETTLPAARKTQKFEYRASCGTAIVVPLQTHKKIQAGIACMLKSTRGRIVAEGFMRKVA